MLVKPSAPWLAVVLSAIVGSPARAPGQADPGRPPSPTVRLSRPGDPRAAFEVMGLDPSALAGGPDRWAEILTVETAPDPSGGPDDRPPLLGSYRVEGGALRFQPRFPMEPGLRYRAVVRLPGRGPVTTDFRLPKRAPASATEVARVAPARDVLPENLLKFYLEFSAPMSRGEAYDRVRLLDAAGRPIDLPFLELGEELWDPRGKRFTLLFDPGRIKTGLRPREELGPVLEAGKTYTLVIDPGWRDAAGNPLRSEFRKAFRVGPPDTTPPDPKTWTLDRPAAGTRTPLVVRFPEPLDRAMLGRVLAVVDARGGPVAGAVAVGGDETSWSFTPERPWTAGGYVVRADRALEDLAGNSIGRPFEVDVFQKIPRRQTAETVALPFTIAEAR